MLYESVVFQLLVFTGRNFSAIYLEKLGKLFLKVGNTMRTSNNVWRNFLTKLQNTKFFSKVYWFQEAKRIERNICS